MAAAETDRNAEALMDKVQSLRAEIASLTTGIGAVIDTDLKQAGEGAIDWGTIGSLEHVRDRLHETLEYCTGIHLTAAD